MQKIATYLCLTAFIFLAMPVLAFTDKDSTIYNEQKHTVASTILHNFNKPPEEKPKFIDRLRFGANFGLQVGNVILFNISPAVIFLATDRLYIGAGPVYIYTRINSLNLDGHSFGVRYFNWYDVYNGLILHIEYEYLNFQLPGNTIRLNAHNLMVGAGYVQKIGNRALLFASLLYSLTHFQADTPYSSPFIIKIGAAF